MDQILLPWVLATTIMIFVAAFWIYALEKRVAKFRSDYEALIHIAAALEAEPSQAILLPIVKQLEGHAGRLGRAESRLQHLESLLPRAVRGIGIVRYNAFEGVGGDQSFSIALMDAEGHGAVLTGIHTGTDVRSYGKPIENWKSSYSLSADEQRALGEARRRMEEASAQSVSAPTDAAPGHAGS
jgi:hypothetical protein